LGLEEEGERINNNHNPRSAVDDYEEDAPKDPAEMTVAEWLEEIKMGQYAEIFENEGWDSLDAVFTMSQEDLLEIGVKRGHIRRMLLAMGRDQDIGSLARESIARGMSYARGRPEPSISRQGAARFSPLNIKPWARDSYEDNYNDHPQPLVSTQNLLSFSSC